MKRYHVNPKTGSPSICRADTGKCPYGGDTGQKGHYDTYGEAQKASQKFFEKMYEILPGAFNVNQEEVEKGLRENRKLKNEEEVELPSGTTFEISDGISNSKNEELVMAVINGEIYRETGWDHTSVALQNPNISRKFLEDALYHYPEEFEPHARKWMTLNKSLTNEELIQIIENDSEDIDVRMLAFKNPNLSEEYVSDIIENRTSELDTVPYSMIYFSEHRNKKTDILREDAIILQRRDGSQIMKAHKLSAEYVPWDIKRLKEGNL